MVLAKPTSDHTHAAKYQSGHMKYLQVLTKCGYQKASSIDMTKSKPFMNILIKIISPSIESYARGKVGGGAALRLVETSWLMETSH